jgi:AcrR family transcriptional regulator
MPPKAPAKAPVKAPRRAKAAAKPVPKGPLTAQDWIRAALNLIIREGVQAVAVEPLAREIGVTKGSFYWHFENRDHLVKEALKAWAEDQGKAVVARWSGVPDPERRLRVLLFSAFEDQENGLLFAALSASSEDPRVQPFLRRVSEERLSLGVESFKALGLADTEAKQKALLAYAAYAGYFQLLRATPAAVAGVSDLSGYVHHLVDGLVPPRKGKK